VANSSNNTVSVFINNGAGAFPAKVDYTTGRLPIQLQSETSTWMANLNLAVANFSGKHGERFYQQRHRRLCAKVDYATGSTPVSVAVGDFNLDGKPDLGRDEPEQYDGERFYQQRAGAFPAKV